MRVAVGFAFSICLLGAAACAPQPAPASFPPASPPPQNAQAAPSPPPSGPGAKPGPAASSMAPEGLPPGPGAAILTKSCTVCHGVDQVTSQHQSAGQWRDTVNQMIGMGADVSDPDSAVLIDYLAKNFGA